jgi:Spy/CpxP family protein refolding chaperone
MNMLRRTLVSLALVLAPAALGCGGTVSSEPPATAETATTLAPVAVTAHGPVKMFGDALGEVPLTASQRSAIEQMASDAESRHAGARTARQDLMVTLAAQIEAGALDRAALQPKLAAITAAMQASQPADRAAIDQLHAVLTAEQRATFVDAMQAQISQRVGAMKGHHSMKQWAEDLQLTDDQKAQIKAAVMQKMSGGPHPDWADFRGAKHQGDALWTAFKQAAFSIDQVAPPKDVGQQVSHGAGRFLDIAEVAIPILTPAQRTLAAQKLREKAGSGEAEGAEPF